MKLQYHLDRLAASDSDEGERSWLKEAKDLRTALDEYAIVTITDPQGRITYVNDRFCAISGYSREELIGQDHRILNSGHHPQEFFQNLWDTITDGNVWHGGIKNRAQDGSFYWVATTIVPFMDAGGKPRQYMATSFDITAQKRLEDELWHKVRLQGLLTQLSTLFVTLLFEQVNDAITEVQRYIVETLGLDRSTLWQSDDDHPGMAQTHCWQRPGLAPLPEEFQIEDQLPWVHARVKAGEVLHFNSIADLPPVAARDAEVFRLHGVKSYVSIPLIANREVFGAIAFATLGEERQWRPDEMIEFELVGRIIANALGRQRAEKRAESLRAEIAHSTRAARLGELVAALAHELNQPLTSILSNAQAGRRFLAGGKVDLEEFRAILDDVIRDGKRAGGVVQNLRAMLSKAPVVRDQCCMNELVEEVIGFMHSEFVGHQIELRHDATQSLPPVCAARVEMQQVLVNLLLNAEQAMKQTPRELRHIDITTRVENKNVLLTVRDHGQGIDPERLNNMFEPFVTTKAAGLGMGLAICRRIVESHGGRIEAHNPPDGGAEFSITLPATAMQ